MTEIEKNVVLNYAENNMDVSKTARATHYHRNTMEYHLKRIAEKYGLNPRKFYDLIDLVDVAKGGAGVMASCNTCKANRVCDHNKYGFENCNNYISADVEEVKHGEWVLDEERYVHRVRQEKPTKFVTLRCSECGQRKARNIRFKYCPNCGAIMDNTPKERGADNG